MRPNPPASRFRRSATTRNSSRSAVAGSVPWKRKPAAGRDRKSTRLNSSHGYISYAVFSLKKKIKVCVRQVVYLDLTAVFTVAGGAGRRASHAVTLARRPREPHVVGVSYCFFFFLRGPPPPHPPPSPPPRPFPN